MRFAESMPGYSIAEVSVMMGVKPSTVRSWICRRELGALKIGTRRFVTEEQISRFLDSRKNETWINKAYAK